jgi:mono/diheme cytochrome c family protein
MRTRLSSTSGALAPLALCLVLLACSGGATPANPGAQPPVNASPTPAAPAQPVELSHADLVKRGQQLVQLGGCHDCHTPMKFDPKLGMPVPQMSLMLSGHPQGGPDPQGQPGQGDQAVIGPTFTAFRLPFGVVYSANLTPDPETGLGRVSEADFIRVVRTGHRHDSPRVLLPPMPWQNLAQQQDTELRAIYAYLQSIPAISNRVPVPQVPPPVIAEIEKSYRAAAAASASPN